jgi:signal transduction histidine kinase
VIGSQLRDLSSEVHRFSLQLHPAQLGQLGLVAAAREYCKEIEERWSVTVQFRERGTIPTDLDTSVALCLYRVLQEALQNSVRHGDSNEVSVQLRREEDQLRLVIKDNGKGFEMKSQMHPTGLGMVSMRERVRQVFGSIEIRSKPGQGTHVEVMVPLLGKTAT